MPELAGVRSSPASGRCFFDFISGELPMLGSSGIVRLPATTARVCGGRTDLVPPLCLRACHALSIPGRGDTPVACVAGWQARATQSRSAPSQATRVSPLRRGRASPNGKMHDTL